ncbi:MAG: SRPBCC domain-containing protein [Anaerolineales bacterium]
MINISDEYTFESSREVVWSNLLNPDFLIDIIPGCEHLGIDENGEYHGEIKIGLAGISGSYTTRITITDIKPPEYCNLKGEITGKSGFVTGQVEIQLFEEGDSCRMVYQGTGIITGALSHLNSRFLVGIAQSLITNGLGKMNNRILSER